MKTYTFEQVRRYLKLSKSEPQNRRPYTATIDPGGWVEISAADGTIVAQVPLDQWRPEYDPENPAHREAVIAAIEQRLVAGNLVTITRQEFDMLRSQPHSGEPS